LRLILFSGGVESTALLTQAEADDILLTINPVYPSDLKTYDQHRAERIAAHFGHRIHYASASIPVDPLPFRSVHQMRVFVSIANLWVAKDGGITEVWCGRNSAEPSEELRPFIDQMMRAWDVLQPNVAFRHPLDHLTKRQQLELIPNAVRPHLSSCIHHRWCGICKKCLEWLPLSENTPAATPR
jgi:7-cyano-7-deazaguanine synthase in queuosine biosynthesis